MRFNFLSSRHRVLLKNTKSIYKKLKLFYSTAADKKLLSEPKKIKYYNLQTLNMIDPMYISLQISGIIILIDISSKFSFKVESHLVLICQQTINNDFYNTFDFGH